MLAIVTLSVVTGSDCARGPQPIDVTALHWEGSGSGMRILNTEDPCYLVGFSRRSTVTLERRRFAGRVWTCVQDGLPYPANMLLEGTVHGHRLQYRISIPIDGRFEVPNLATGAYVGVVCLYGFDVIHFDLTIKANGTKEPVNLRLSFSESVSCEQVG